MSFYAKDFIFNNIMSQSLGLTISSDGAEDANDAGSNVEPVIIKIFRRPTNYLVGVEQGPVLTFPVSFNSENKINAVFAARIERILFGQMFYKKLQVIQPDTSMYYWNCFLESPKRKRVGGEIVGYSATVTCDSPWAKSFPRDTLITLNPPTPLTYNLNNRSGNNDYTYPKVEFQMSNAGGYLLINNVTDSRGFYISGLAPNEIITIDNDLQIITSSLNDTNRLPNFNKNWFREVPDLNVLNISGNAKYIKITQTDAQKIGG